LSYLRKAVTRVKTADLEALLAFLEHASSVEDLDPFPRSVVASLHGLVPSDIVTYCELDRLRKVCIRSTAAPEIGNDDESELELYWRLRDQHPVCHHHERTRDFRAWRISDFVSRTELRRRAIYWEYFRPWEIEHQLTVGLDAPLTHTKVFVLTRSGGRDFTQRDRELLNLLRPHLQAIYERARVRRAARNALALLERTGEAVVVLDGSDRIAHATPEARRVLTTHFRPSGERLPAEVAEWLRRAQGAPRVDPLTLERGGQQVAVHLVDGCLFFETQQDTARLTNRESEIVVLLAGGKTNAEIAETLWISPGTVRKHLENVYEKLGVHSRTAAVAKVRSERSFATG
jgi:DNA-binding CsgD family transcriptional regulator